MAADEINSGIAANCSPEDAGLGASDRAARLLRLPRLAEDLGARQIGKEARDLARRVTEGRFYVASIGPRKRGKSTLINALIGDSILSVLLSKNHVKTGRRIPPSRFPQNGSFKTCGALFVAQYIGGYRTSCRCLRLTCSGSARK
jgi:hypothetical protein